ncbi:MAG: type II secretion system protein [Acidobacteriota bacterium]|nr:type II secretion system protein [Acidobacteriota bacterium]
MCASFQRRQRAFARRSRAHGLTMVELIVTIAIMAILATAVLPISRNVAKREKERELRAALWQMRDAIDRYKDAADRGAFQVKLGSEGYPPDLDTLAEGVTVGANKVRFLRHIPKDPMTNSYDWGMRSVQDDPNTESWGGQDVFDVYTKSTGTGLDGTKYSEW